MSHTFAREVGLVLAALLASTMFGCAGAKVEPTMRASTLLPKPDMIIVYDFAVTVNDVKLDQGVVATAMRDTKDAKPNQEEIRVGRRVAEKLSQTLVSELTDSGIAAVRASPEVQGSATSALLTGEFVTVNEGNQDARVLIGFGLGDSNLHTRVRVSQGGDVVAEAKTKTSWKIKPGMAAVGEVLEAAIESNAKDTAKQIAKRIHKAYVERGWLAK